MAIVAVPDGSVRATAPWQHWLKSAIRKPLDLFRELSLPTEFLPAAERASRTFPLFAPLPFVASMRPGDVRDPLLRQVLPVADELEQTAGFLADPVGDGEATLTAGLIKKYQGRALLVTTGACAVHCRYCFRRHFPYEEAPHTLAAWQPALDAIARDESIHEVILSGGDPLMLVDDHLAALSRRLAEVPHVRRLRIHTRLPIMIPDRVSDELLAWLCDTRLVPVVVVHANHPAELSNDVESAVGRLVRAGVTVLNQSVLLQGVNDDATTLIELSERLVELRVVPYYLHQLDRVVGAAHFEVPVEYGQEIMTRVRASLPGYAVPRYVREVAGAASKQVLA